MSFQNSDFVNMAVGIDHDGEAAQVEKGVGDIPEANITTGAVV